MPPDVLFHELPLETRLSLRLRGDRAVFLTGDDNLQVSSWNSLTGVTVTIVGRLLGLDGDSRPFVHIHTPNTDRTIATIVRKLGEGWLTECSAFVSAGAPIIGQTFIRIQIVRGLDAATQALATLAADYITAVQPLGWPGSPIRRSVDGRGAIRSVTGTDPAVNVEISESVPTGARWRLLAFFARFVTDATVANRMPILTIDDGTNVLLQSDPPEAQTANQGFGWVGMPAGERLVSVWDTKHWVLPSDVRLLAGHRIRTVVGNRQIGDNGGAAQLLVEEWLEGSA